MLVSLAFLNFIAHAKCNENQVSTRRIFVVMSIASNYFSLLVRFSEWSTITRGCSSLVLLSNTPAWKGRPKTLDGGSLSSGVSRANAPGPTITICIAQISSVNPSNTCKCFFAHTIVAHMHDNSFKVILTIISRNLFKCSLLVANFALLTSVPKQLC